MKKSSHQGYWFISRSNLLLVIAIITASIIAFSVFGDSKIKVGLIVNNQVDQIGEIKALTKFLDTHGDDVRYQLLPIDHITSLKNFDVVWYHRPDSTAIMPKERELGKKLVDYVSGGGQLMLSMDAVRCLNTWNIEPTKIQVRHYKAFDEGYGRKLGFHGFRSHPLFDKLFGGAYTWHGKKDNICRILGFFGDSLPTAKNTHIIGTLWEYIFYHPHQKVIWETTLGEGRILAIGACLYYGKPNFNQPILDQFTLNCLNYLKGNRMESKARYWEYTTPGVSRTDFSYSPVRLPAPTAWKIAKTENSLIRKATGYSYDLSTHRSLIVGREKAGIEEIWTHPFMSVRDFKTYLDLEGTDSLVSLENLTPTVEMRPNAFIRTYHVGQITLKEIITSHILAPATVDHYQWSGKGLKRIVTDFKCNLRFMWPYDSDALGSVFYDWSDDLNAFLVADKNQEFCSLVGANVKGKLLESGRFDRFIEDRKELQGVTTDKLQVASAVSFNVEDRKALDIIMVAGNIGKQTVVDTYKSVLNRPDSVFSESQNYYQKYLAGKFSVVTPDSNFNDGFRWAIIRSSQFITHTPGIGTSLTAGNSSSRTGWGGAQKVSGRPGYAWYFGRDAVWSGLAFSDIGDFSTVKDVLKTFIRFQSVTGKIYHELTTSGSVHYDASDATPLFVILMSRYLQSSGDIDFVKENMDAVHKAMDYCYSTDTDGDHLIEIANVGHGWLEGGVLYGSKTEFYLSGIWAEALKDAAYLSRVTGNQSKQKQYAQDAKTVIHILNSKFWNPEGYYNYGKKADGTFTKDLIVLPVVPVYLGVTDSAKSLEMVKQFGTDMFSADWGVRMISDHNPLFNPSGYHTGAVWPLFTGWTALSEYHTGRYLQGYRHILSNLTNYKEFSLGCVPEVLNGQTYQPGGVTLHQCWSETMVLQPVIEGMLGFRSNALDHSLELRPRFPFNWDSCSVKNLCVGDIRIGFHMAKFNGKTVYTFSSNKAVTIDFEPTFALGTQITSLKIDGKETKFSTADNPEYATIKTKVRVPNKAVVEVEYQEGVSVLPTFIPSGKGKSSSGFQILGQHLEGKSLVVDLQGLPGKTYPIDLYLPDGYQDVQGLAEIKQRNHSVYAGKVLFEPSGRSYALKTVKVNLIKF